MNRFDRVYIEISNICNLKCNFCPPVERNRAVMPASLFSRIAAQLQGQTSEICLHLMGEPLGHPELALILDEAERFKLPVNLTTNGVLLTPRLQQLCLHPVIRQVNISIHSFEANFGTKDVTAYLQKVFGFTEAAFAGRPEMYINYRLWDLASPHALSEKNQKIREALEDRFHFSFDAMGIDIRRKKGYRVQNRLYIHFDSRFTWPSLAEPWRAQQGTCHALSRHIGILADGRVVPCCLDKEAVINLGELQTQSLEEILLSPRASRMKTGFQQGRLLESLCQRCSFVARFERNLRRRSAALGTEPGAEHRGAAPVAPGR